MNRRLAAAVLAATLVPSFAVAAALLEDENLQDLSVSEFGSVGGLLDLEGNPIGNYGNTFNASCGPLSGASAVTVTGTEATYTADCGTFDVVATVRLLAPLTGATGPSSGYDVEWEFTNTAGMSQNLTLVVFYDDDMGTGGGDDEVAYDPFTGVFRQTSVLEDPDVQQAIVAGSDDPAAVFGYDIGQLGTIDLVWPLEGNGATVGPADVGYSLGFQSTVAAGASVTYRFRHAFARGSIAVIENFGFSDCYREPATGCVPGNKGLLSIKNDADASKDKLIWKFINGGATTQADFGDPTDDGDFTLCIYDGNDDPLTSLYVPQSATHWTAITTMGYKFADASGGNSGVTKTQLKGGDDGKSKIVLLAKGENLPDPTLGALATPLVAQMNSGGKPGKCWNTTLATTVSNLSSLLKAKAP